MNMEILLIKNRLPFPLRSGQDLVDYSLIRALSLNYEITLISPCESLDHVQEALPELKKFCKEIITVPMPELHSIGSKLSWRIKREINFWLGLTPLEVTDLSYEPLRRRIHETALQHKFVFAEIAFWMMGQYYREIKSQCPVVLLEHDSNFLNIKRQRRHRRAQKITKQIRDWYAEMTTMMDYEKRICQSCDWILFLSSADMESVKENYNIADRTCTIPVPYYIQPEAVGGIRATSANIVFLGGMHTPYNVESIRYFKNSILPKILSEIPEIMLTIVGNPPHKGIAHELDSPHIRYIGFQKDLTETLKEFQVLIAPIWIGTGIKTKIIEGIARGMPIVATPIGVEGMELTPGKDFLLANSDEEFAQNVIRLLLEPDLRKNIARNALERFKSSFSFEQESPKTLATYEFLLNHIRDGK